MVTLQLDRTKMKKRDTCREECPTYMLNRAMLLPYLNHIKTYSIKVVLEQKKEKCKQLACVFHDTVAS